MPDIILGTLCREASLETQDPKNKLILTKCIQKIIKKPSFDNNARSSSTPKYKLKIYILTNAIYQLPRCQQGPV